MGSGVAARLGIGNCYVVTTPSLAMTVVIWGRPLPLNPTMTTLFVIGSKAICPLVSCTAPADAPLNRYGAEWIPGCATPEELPYSLYAYFEYGCYACDELIYTVEGCPAPWCDCTGDISLITWAK
jgi:hypothetical protein